MAALSNKVFYFFRACIRGNKSCESGLVTPLEFSAIIILIKIALADGLLGPAAPFKVHQSLIPLQRLYTAEAEGEVSEGGQDSAAVGVNGLQAASLGKETIIENAVTREWHRIRLHRMGLAV